MSVICVSVCFVGACASECGVSVSVCLVSVCAVYWVSGVSESGVIESDVSMCVSVVVGVLSV